MSAVWQPLDVRNREGAAQPKPALAATPTASAPSAWRLDLRHRATSAEPAPPFPSSPRADLILRADLMGEAARLLATLTPETVETWLPLPEQDARDFAAWAASQPAWADWRVEVVGEAIRVVPANSAAPAVHMSAGRSASPSPRAAAPPFLDEEERRAVDGVLDGVAKGLAYNEYWLAPAHAGGLDHHDRAERVAVWIREREAERVASYAVWADAGTIFVARTDVRKSWRGPVVIPPAS